jgi:Uma2 family endonuclease
MSAAIRLLPMSVDEYLEGELQSEVKHEYLGGFVYAMAGGRNVHNLIASNVLGALHRQLRGKACRPYNSDAKIRIKLPTHTRFYYPDVSVVCDSNPPQDTFQDRPALVVEVASGKTRRIDLGEKKDAYCALPSLYAYVVFEQNSAAATVFRRTDDGFVQQVVDSIDAVIPFGEIGAELALAEVYENIQFEPEPGNEE